VWPGVSGSTSRPVLVSASGLQIRLRRGAALDHRLHGHRRKVGGAPGDRLMLRSMPAYVIAETDVHDPERYERYKAAAPDTIAKYGGRYLARGGEHAVLEGDWQPPRLVILEFDDLEAAKRWYASPEYQEARGLREGAATMRIVSVEGT
jgi:uncharacterized protein (DUF1330 family)